MDVVIDHRIKRVNQLLDRLDRIPQELDTINDKLFSGGMDRMTFVHLVDRRNNLILELENKTKELKEVYNMKV